ncbi:MAG: PF20097 family protein [Firmicutes bacterium]|nr:PF20097 family protein [Bacillota bacterium]
MICSRCNGSTVEGFIPAAKMAIVFVPNDGGKMPKTIYGTGDNTIPLTKVPIFKTQKAQAFFCPNCNIVIAPVKDLN